MNRPIGILPRPDDSNGAEARERIGKVNDLLDQRYVQVAGNFEFSVYVDLFFRQIKGAPCQEKRYRTAQFCLVKSDDVVFEKKGGFKSVKPKGV